MKYAYFPGCKIPHHLPQYGVGVKAVCAALGVELVDLEFNCCGWPLRDESYLASVFSAARNLALAAQEGLSILTPCKCCLGNLKMSLDRLNRSPDLAQEVNRLLAQEGLQPGRPRVTHLLTVLDQEVGIGMLKAGLKKPLAGLKVACHYGCHALRPAGVTGFDDPLNPTIFERIVEVLGAEAVPWDLRLECCGYPLRGRDETTSRRLMRAKLLDAGSAGAEMVVTACTYCQLQFETERNLLSGDDSLNEAPPAVLVTQLLTEALGL